jgi:hypothetical protein
MPILLLAEVLRENKSTNSYDGIYYPAANATLVRFTQGFANCSSSIILLNGELGKVVYPPLSQLNIWEQQCSMAPQ